jgi:hypothetical protein
MPWISILYGPTVQFANLIFYDICQGFYDNNICLQSINNSYIMLIAKTENSSTVSDYKPISLLNSSIKQTTKILANILQTVILKMIHHNQYGFIRNRNIQDCLTWTFEYLHICHKSKKRKEMVITVEREVIIWAPRHKGFLRKWVE